MNWSQLFAKRCERLKPSTIREILKLTRAKDVISFAGGLPAPQLFPAAELAAAAAKVLREEPEKALQYSTTEGTMRLRRQIAERLEGATPERVQIVSGSQQGIDLIAKVLLDPGDKVVVAAPTYMGALRAFDAYEASYLTVACDDAGMLPDALEAALQQNPKFVYVIPDFDNPSGVTMTLERRKALLELAERYGVPVLEDSPYAELRFEGAALPRLYELAPEQVAHVGTFSKILAPGLRLAWVVAPEPLLAQVYRAKQATDLHTAAFTQVLVHEVLQGDFLAGQLERVRRHYRLQRDLMLAALDAYFPQGVRWTRPTGGMFVWVTLPAGVDAEVLLRRAVERKVAFVPGTAFFANGGGENTLRLSYSVATPEQVERGMAALGEVIAAALGEAQPAGAAPSGD